MIEEFSRLSSQIDKLKGLNVRDVFLNACEVMKPPKRQTVSEYICSTMRIAGTQGNSKPYNISRTEYMREPLDLCTSRRYTEIVFMGPARTGKSESLLKGFCTYCIGASKQNLLVIHMTQDKAAEWCRNELQPMLHRSPALKQYLTDNQNDITLHEIHLKAQNYISVKWPSINNLSAVTIQNVIFTDYDRLPADIDGQGSPYILGKKRTTTFGNGALCIAESSPGFPVYDPDEEVEPHVCPQSMGIANLYNLGDQRCFYFKCPTCEEYFWAEPSTIYYDKQLEDQKAKAESARVQCPKCGALYTTYERNTILIPNGVWLKRGETIDKNGVKHGIPPKNKIASFWLRAPACAFNSLADIVYQYLQAEESYNKTGDEGPLKAYYNTTLGEPYVPKALQFAGFDQDELFKHCISSEYQINHVPQDTRFMYASVDIQNGRKGRFEYMILAVDSQCRIHMVYRGKLTHYNGESIRPESYWEHFKAIEELFKYRAKVYGYHNKYMKIHGIVLDCGGFGATADNARLYFLDFKKRHSHGEYAHKDALILVKGAPKQMKANLNWSNVSNDSKVSRVPLLLIKSDYYKNIMFNTFSKNIEDAGSIVLHAGLPKRVFLELQAEEMNRNGHYEKKRGFNRNESIDLLYYFFGYLDARNIRKYIFSCALATTPSYLYPIEKGNSLVEEIDADEVETITELQDIEEEDKLPVKIDEQETPESTPVLKVKASSKKVTAIKMKKPQIIKNPNRMVNAMFGNKRF